MSVSKAFYNILLTSEQLKVLDEAILRRSSGVSWNSEQVNREAKIGGNPLGFYLGDSQGE